jgi:hypothetical protein
VRLAAALALGVLGDGRAVEPLIARLEDAAWDVRSAAEALGMLRDERAVEPLIARLEDAAWDVRRATALRAVPTLTLRHNLIPVTARQLVPALALLLILWATRLWALDAFPLHVDEGIHIAWAVEVWNGHPFWNISDAKIIGHWPIALFYPQHAPVYAARLPVILIAMLGLAAGWSLLQNVFGARAALLGALLWIVCP